MGQRHKRAPYIPFLPRCEAPPAGSMVRATLAQFGIATDSACTCGPVVQEVHILWSCPHLETECSEMFSSDRQVSLGPAFVLLSAYTLTVY